VLGAALAIAPAGAAAQEPDPKAVEDARWHFTEGTAHFQAKRYAEALAAFERSYSFAASPNTELLIARCYRELGRRAEAATAFEHAEKEARRRAASGETKYVQTADAAAAEGAQVRARLGTVKVHVAHPDGATVTIDGRPLAVSPEGDATILHDPGSATVVVKDAAGAQQRQTVTVLAGSSVQMDFSGEANTATPPVKPPPPPPPPPEPRSANNWAVPAAIASGTVTLAGLGMFVGFGLSSKATYDDLAKRCGPSSCGPADRADADSGRRQQTVANVGLVIGAVGLVATTAFVVIALTSGRDSATAPAPLFHGRFDARGAAGL
jgi:hypothetical protein